jgi:hypothetical protein
MPGQVEAVMLEKTPVFDGADGAPRARAGCPRSERGARAGLRRASFVRASGSSANASSVTPSPVISPMRPFRSNATRTTSGREAFAAAARSPRARRRGLISTAPLGDDAKRAAPHVARRLFDVTGAAQSFDETLARKILPGTQHARRGIHPARLVR